MAQPVRQRILDIIQKTTALFQERGIESPRFDAETLISHSLGMDRMALYLNHEMPVQEEELALLRPLVARRANREPMQYILGEAPFMDMILQIGKGVLIPRPDTEILVETVARWWKQSRAQNDQSASMLDLCTGSGAIPVALCRMLGKSIESCAAVDISPQACRMAEGNVKRFTPDRIKVIQGDLFQALEGTPYSSIQWDIITSNPPYIPSRELTGLMPEVSRFEPHLALDGGSDGLYFYRLLVSQTLARLSPGGRLFMEVGIGQADPVCELMELQGFAKTGREMDLCRIQRVVWGEKASGE